VHDEHTFDDVDHRAAEYLCATLDDAAASHDCRADIGIDDRSDIEHDTRIEHDGRPGDHAGDHDHRAGRDDHRRADNHHGVLDVDLDDDGSDHDRSVRVEHHDRHHAGHRARVDDVAARRDHDDPAAVLDVDDGLAHDRPAHDRILHDDRYDAGHRARFDDVAAGRDRDLGADEFVRDLVESARRNDDLDCDIGSCRRTGRPGDIHHDRRREPTPHRNRQQVPGGVRRQLLGRRRASRPAPSAHLDSAVTNRDEPRTALAPRTEIGVAAKLRLRYVGTESRPDGEFVTASSVASPGRSPFDAVADSDASPGNAATPRPRPNSHPNLT